MAGLPTGQGLTAAQWEAWFTANTTKGNPKYTGTAKAGGTVPLAGKTWAQVYAALYATGQTLTPKQTPDQIGTATEQLALEEALGLTIGAAEVTAGQGIGAVGTGVSTASFLPPWADGLANFLSALTSPALWIRVAKIVVGGALLLIGVAHMTGADNAVASAARKVPLPI